MGLYLEKLPLLLTFRRYSFMQTGYDADDIYMMVEDEFQTVAQSFTHHLHHAEYVRLKKKARQTPLPISCQPVEGMHTEVKRKLEAKGLYERQNGAVNSMVARAARGISDDEEEETIERDPWQGTSLAGLMASDASQKRTALLGLDKMSSSTRAAKGFSRGERDLRGKQEEMKSILEISGRETNRSWTASAHPQAFLHKVDVEEGEDGDLDTGPKVVAEPRPRKVGLGQLERPENTKDVDMLLAAPRNSITKTSRSLSRSEALAKTSPAAESSRPFSRFVSISKRSKIDDLDEFHESLRGDSPTHPKPTLTSTNKSRLGRKEVDDKERKARLNQVPTFLV